MKLVKVTRFSFSVTSEENAIFFNSQTILFVIKQTRTYVEEVRYVKTAKPLHCTCNRRKKEKEINYTPNVFLRNFQLVNFTSYRED